MSTPNPIADDQEDSLLGLDDYETDDDSVESTDDGGAIIKVTEDQQKKVDEDESFYDNIVTDVNQDDLETVTLDLCVKIDRDIDDVKQRDKKYEEGIRRTGLGDDAPGGADFEGASRAVHPMITKGVVAYMSSTIKELMPPDGPVKTKILGKITQNRLDKADRKKDYMNWQCTTQMPELRHEMEQGLTQEGLNGAFYLRLVFDGAKRRPVPQSINSDCIILPSSATSFYSAERATFKEYVNKMDYDQRVREGEYIDADMAPPSMIPEISKAQEANNKVEGITTNPYNQDGVRLLLHVRVDLQVEDGEDYPKPYIITIDHTTKKAVCLVRNWEEDDPNFLGMDWIVEFPFIPWRGPYPVGLIHLIGSLSAAATGTLRALLDSGHINNLPTLLKLKGSNTMGQSIDLQTTGVHEIEGSVATDDIRKLMMAVPYNPPSMALFQLLGFLVSEGTDVVKITMETLADQSVNQMPVGTTLALIEQGLKVLSAIHGRQHRAFARFLAILHRINRMYLTDDEIFDETGELLCYRSDFEGPLDIIPVSDPEIFSDVQRYAQMQLVEQRATAAPDLYDRRKVEQMILRRTKIPDAEDLLLPAQTAQEMNAVNENVALTLGRPVTAYPDQDHLAHIQVLLDYLTAPYLGQLPIIAPTFIPGALTHLKEHIALWYVSYMEKASSAAVGKDITKLMQYKDPKTREELDKLLATVSSDKEGGTQAQSNKAFSALPPIIDAAHKLLASMSNPAAAVQQTPQVAVAQIKSQDQAQDRQLKAQELQQKAQESQTEQQTRMAETQANNEAEDQRSSRNLIAQAAGVQAEEENKMRTTEMSQSHEDARVLSTNASKERINAADNSTAEVIADAEIEAGKHSNLSTGTGIGKHESKP